METVTLTKSDARRALVRHHFAFCADLAAAFSRLRSVQFDPLAPIGCNHDLVLRARVPGYRVGEWEVSAYKERRIYDGWDKMASLVPMEGWPVRRLFHDVFRPRFEKTIFEDHRDAVEAILKEIGERGPLLPKECDFQLRKEEWKGSWYGPSVTKQTLRALWHTGLVMTAGRKNGQHMYDLTERVVPRHYLNEPRWDEMEAKVELALERHRAMGLLRPVAPPEVWSYTAMTYIKRDLIAELVRRGNIVPVNVEGMETHATADFLSLLDLPSLEPRVVFVGPLDPFLWDRKMIGKLYGFDYTWEVYVPEPKRKWGYYVLPVLFGDNLVARAEFWCRDGALEIRAWHFEPGQPEAAFWPALEKALGELMRYCSAGRVVVTDSIDSRVREVANNPNVRGN